MKTEQKTPEQVEIEKQKGVRKAHEGAWTMTEVEEEAKKTEQARLKTEQKAAANKVKK